jgi:sulfur-carrier protein adenylyltransferase/sulfurtransferase
MVTGKEDLLQSLMEAFLMEKGTHEFYSDASAKALSADARKTFVDLSEWEEKHMEFIEFLYLSIQEDRDIEGFEKFKKKADAPVVEGGIPVSELEERLEKYEFIDDMGALIMALEIEGKAYNLYRNMSDKAADGNAKVVFREMMEQELKHIDYLKEMRNRLAETS